MSLKKNLYKILGIFFLLLFNFDQIQASNFKKESNLEIINQKNEIRSEYIIGVGDTIFVNFKGIPIFTNEYTVNREGQTYMPEIGILYVEGYTVLELKKILLEKYQDFIKDPDIDVIISQYRPVKFSLIGEVHKPGLYTLEYKFDKGSSNFDSNILRDYETNFNFKTPLLSEVPRAFDAIQLGGGFTEYANLSEIKIIRINSKSQGGGKISTEINLISLLENGDFSQNILIQDGDSIVIKKDDSPIIEQLNSIYRSNMTPDIIQVFVNGNVLKPGVIKIDKGSSLLEAIAAAGGQQNNTGRIEFIRLKNGESSDKRIFNFDSQSQKGSISNPILRNGDIIYVRKNLLGKTTSALEEISNPLFSGYGLIKLFE